MCWVWSIWWWCFCVLSSKSSWVVFSSVLSNRVRIVWRMRVWVWVKFLKCCLLVVCFVCLRCKVLLKIFLVVIWVRGWIWMKSSLWASLFKGAFFAATLRIFCFWMLFCFFLVLKFWVVCLCVWLVVILWFWWRRVKCFLLLLIIKFKSVLRCCKASERWRRIIRYLVSLILLVFCLCCVVFCKLKLCLILMLMVLWMWVLRIRLWIRNKRLLFSFLAVCSTRISSKWFVMWSCMLSLISRERNLLKWEMRLICWFIVLIRIWVSTAISCRKTLRTLLLTFKSRCVLWLRVKILLSFVKWLMVFNKLWWRLVRCLMLVVLFRASYSRGIRTKARSFSRKRRRVKSNLCVIVFEYLLC